MKRTFQQLVATVLVVGVPAFSQPNRLTEVERDEGFVLLFDGESLDGWDGDPNLWSVRDGSIVGSSDSHAVDTNTFLIHQKSFDDFVLRLEVRLRNGNSGIQFRSKHVPGPGWVVHGYQADLSDAGDRSAWGNFYEEKGRGRSLMATPDEGWRRAKDVVLHRQWNRYEIRAEGDRLRLTLNGKVTFEGTDDRARAGIIAIQLHAGPAMQVECRRIRIKPL
ncbi:MAG: DUF1080 domain-containing protein [Bryobacterales bacterium]|nr:DUF1080 domain-containing protein [Bryobacterales bacterium]MDE0265366.1 DUF1080 domain-containing protein [Bryobacterales bacterium]